MPKPEPRVVGSILSAASPISGPYFTTMVECPRCFALIAGDRREDHESWHKIANLGVGLG